MRGKNDQCKSNCKLKETTYKYEDEMVSLLSSSFYSKRFGEEAEMQKAVFQLFSSLKGETTKIPMKESLRRPNMLAK